MGLTSSERVHVTSLVSSSLSPDIKIKLTNDVSVSPLLIESDIKLYRLNVIVPELYLNWFNCLKEIFISALFSASSNAIPISLSVSSDVAFLSVVSSVGSLYLFQCNSSTDLKLVIDKSSSGSFLIICCGIIIYPEKLLPNWQTISTFPVSTLGIIHSVIYFQG